MTPLHYVHVLATPDNRAKVREIVLALGGMARVVSRPVDAPDEHRLFVTLAVEGAQVATAIWCLLPAALLTTGPDISQNPSVKGLVAVCDRLETGDLIEHLREAFAFTGEPE